MKRQPYILLATYVMLGMLIVGCGAVSLPGGKSVTITMIYGSEKEEWLVPLVDAFNDQKNKTEAGSTIRVEATPMGSIASGDGIVDGSLQPTI